MIWVNLELESDKLSKMLQLWDALAHCHKIKNNQLYTFHT
jgi:hypothetical protein